MTIAPIVRTVTVKAAPARAFDLFTGHMTHWWPRGKTIGAQPHVVVVIEPRPDGRWFERDADGAETEWGKVLAWEPPGRALLAWQINAHWTYDPAVSTELELTFEALPEGGTKVTLEHRNLERLGDSAAEVAEQLRNGWPGKLREYADFADTAA
jgi:hypothetical protein